MNTPDRVRGSRHRRALPAGRSRPGHGTSEPVEIDVELDIRADFTAGVVIAGGWRAPGLMAAFPVHVA